MLADSKSKSRSQYHLRHMLLFCNGVQHATTAVIHSMPTSTRIAAARPKILPSLSGSATGSPSRRMGGTCGRLAQGSLEPQFESLQLAKAPKPCRGKFAGNAQGKFGPPTDYHRCDGIRSHGDRHASQQLHCGFEAREFERCAQRKAVLGV